jgi:hypothetical protein
MRQQPGLKNEIKVSELIQSGSLAIKTKNEFGVHVFSGSVSDDGILSGKLYYCRLTVGTFETVSGGGRTVYCIDGTDTPNNQ